MAKKDKNQTPAQLQFSEEQNTAPARPQSASLRAMPVTGPVPVRPVADNVQLTPIVQPIAFVPYSTQKQPLFMFDGETVEVPYYEEDTYEEEYAAPAVREEARPQAQAQAKSKKVFGWVSFLIILLSLVAVAALILGKFVDQVAQYTAVIVKEGAANTYISGYQAISDLFTAFSGGFAEVFVKENIIPIAVLLAGVFFVLAIIGALFRFCRKGANVFTKIVVFLAFACSILALIMSFFSDGAVGIGIFIITGCTLIQLALALLTKSK